MLDSAPPAGGLRAGARFTVSVLDSGFVDIIVGSLGRADHSRVEVETGDISTYVSGELADVVTYLRDVIAGAAAGGVHVSATVSLVRDRSAPPPVLRRPTLESTDLRARAHWTVPGAEPRAVALARELGTHSGEDPFVTRLDGDLAAVLETVTGGWLLAGEDGSWPATHVTISLNSPSPIAQDA